MGRERFKCAALLAMGVGTAAAMGFLVILLLARGGTPPAHQTVDTREATTPSARAEPAVPAEMARVERFASQSPRPILLDRSNDETTRNNAANVLRANGDPLLIDDLVRMLWNDRETPKWRNYCVQQLTQCYLEEPEERILDAVFRAAESPVPTVRSCAVWSLALIVTEADPGQEVVGKAERVAFAALREEGIHFLIRTGGVQASARLGLGEALPGIRRLAGSEETKPASLCVAAVAALGEMKDVESVGMLERLAASASGQLKVAAEVALRKIREVGPRRPEGGAR